MKKIIYILLFLGMLTLLSGCGVDKYKLPGDFIISGKISSDKPIGIYIYSPKEDKLNLLHEGYIGNDGAGIEFNKDKTSILVEKRRDKSIYLIEYDIKNNEEIDIIKDEKIKYRGYDSIKYVPTSNKISYIVDDILYVYDRDANKETAIKLDVDFEQYDWDKKGEKLIYTNDWKIYIYDIKTKENKYLFKGHSPIYSNNNEYIAYKSGDELIVHELETGEEWNLGEIKRISQHKFSPDDKYIAYSEQYSGIVNNPYFKIYVEDYKNGKRTLLLKGDKPLPAFDWK